MGMMYIGDGGGVVDGLECDEEDGMARGKECEEGE